MALALNWYWSLIGSSQRGGDLAGFRGRDQRGRPAAELIFARAAWR